MNSEMDAGLDFGGSCIGNCTTPAGTWLTQYRHAQCPLPRSHHPSVPAQLALSEEPGGLYPTLLRAGPAMHESARGSGHKPSGCRQNEAGTLDCCQLTEACINKEADQPRHEEPWSDHPARQHAQRETSLPNYKTA